MTTQHLRHQPYHLTSGDLRYIEKKCSRRPLLRWNSPGQHAVSVDLIIYEHRYFWTAISVRYQYIRDFSHWWLIAFLPLHFNWNILFICLFNFIVKHWKKWTSLQRNSGVYKISFTLLSFYSDSCYALTNHSRQTPFLRGHTSLNNTNMLFPWWFLLVRRPGSH